MGGMRGSMALFLSYIFLFAGLGAAALRPDYYASTCPNVESIVRDAVTTKFQATIRTVGSTIRLFFHDCFVQGCDASVLIASTQGNRAERDAPDNLSLSFEGFETVRSAKTAVEEACPGQVSCADILAIAARDVIAMSGGIFYQVELGRLDGLSSNASSVAGKLPQQNHTLDQLVAIFAANGLNMSEMIALSGAHSVGLAHCSKFAYRIYNYQPGTPMDPSLNQKYAAHLMTKCSDGGPDWMVLLDPATPALVDNQYYKNLQDGGGLLSSDQVLYSDNRTKAAVDAWARSSADFQRAFADAMVKLGRVGVKSGKNGNIRTTCDAFN